MLWYVLLLVSTCIASPVSYIKPCAVSDHNFNACALEHAKEALPQVVKGDPKLQMPSLDPLHIVELKQKDAVSIILKDIKVSGLKDSQLQKTEFDLKNNKLNLAFLVPVIKLQGKYEISGRLLILPITGNGNLNSTSVDSLITLKADIKDVEKNGKHYVQLENQSIKLEPKRVYLTLDNLFNGNELLGKEMNDFIDKNWKEVDDEVGPPMQQGIAAAAINAVNKLLMSSTRDEFFPQTL